MPPRQTDDELWKEAMGLWLALRERPDDRAAQDEARLWQERGPAHRAAWAEAAELWNLSGFAKPDDATIAVQPLRRPMMSRRRLVIGMGGLAAAGAAVAFGPAIGRYMRTDVTSGTAELRNVVLRDGSTVTLGPDSALRTAFGPSERTVELIEGMAYFDVARAQGDAPFKAVCRDVTLNATSGGAFELSLDAGTIGAAVERGRATVDLVQAGKPSHTTLESGDWLSYEPGTAELNSGRRAAEHQAAWRHGLLVADRDSVRVVAARIARWHEGRVVVMPGLGDRKVSGIFDLRDPVMALEAIAAPFQGRVHRLTRWLTVVSPV